MANPLALYFGCIREPGHYLHDKSSRWVRPEAHGCPWDFGLMDGGLLKTPGVDCICPPGDLHESWCVFGGCHHPIVVVLTASRRQWCADCGSLAYYDRASGRAVWVSPSHASDLASRMDVLKRLSSAE